MKKCNEKEKCKRIIYNLKIALKEAERTIEIQKRIIAHLTGSEKLKVKHSNIIRSIDENIIANIPDNFSVKAAQ